MASSGPPELAKVLCVMTSVPCQKRSLNGGFDVVEFDDQVGSLACEGPGEDKRALLGALGPPSEDAVELGIPDPALVAT